MADILQQSLSNCISRLRNAPQAEGKYSYPDVEANTAAPEVVWSKSSVEVLADYGSNSVRVHVAFKKHDDLEVLISSIFSSFLQKRADEFMVFRKRPVASPARTLDLSFLISDTHIGIFETTALVQFIEHFIHDFEKERTHLKMYTNAKARSVASSFFDALK